MTTPIAIGSDVCSARAAFVLALSDSYSSIAERTEAFRLLTGALRGTAARADGETVALCLWQVALHDWYPRALEADVALIRAACAGTAAVHALRDRKIEESVALVGRLRKAFVPRESRGAALVGLIDLAGFAARDVHAALPDRFARIDLGLRAARADGAYPEVALFRALAGLATRDLTGLAALAAQYARQGLGEAIAAWSSAGRQLRREMAGELLATCGGANG